MVLYETGHSLENFRIRYLSTQCYSKEDSSLGLEIVIFSIIILRIHVFIIMFSFLCFGYFPI